MTRVRTSSELLRNDMKDVFIFVSDKRCQSIPFGKKVLDTVIVAVHTEHIKLPCLGVLSPSLQFKSVSVSFAQHSGFQELPLGVFHGQENTWLLQASISHTPPRLTPIHPPSLRCSQVL